MKLKYNGSVLNDMNMNHKFFAEPDIKFVKKAMKEGKVATETYTFFKLSDDSFVLQLTTGMRYQDYYQVI